MGGLVAGCTLKELFRELLTAAASHQHLTIAEVTEFYLVNLLSDFAAAEKLFADERDGRKDHEPLAILYHRALTQEREERIRTFRRLGDVSLYKAGFFADSLRDRVVGADYYIEMGGAAYGQVASLAPTSGFGAVFQELHDKFRRLVEVLEEIAARGLVANGPLGTMQVFKSWARTGNERLEQVLAEAGVVPSKNRLPN